MESIRNWFVLEWSWKCLVGIGTAVRAGRSGVRTHAGTRVVSPKCPDRSRAYPASFSVYWVSFPGVKRPSSQADQWLQCRTAVTNEWSCFVHSPCMSSLSGEAQL